MKSTAVPAGDWQLTLDEISRCGSGCHVSITITGADIGAQLAAQSVPFHGATYDRKDHMVMVDTAGLEHRIDQPKQVFLAYGGTSISAMEIVDDNDRRHIVSFDPPLDLGASNGHP